MQFRYRVKFVNGSELVLTDGRAVNGMEKALREPVFESFIISDDGETVESVCVVSANILFVRLLADSSPSPAP